MEVRPGYKRTDVGVIPEDWEVRPVGTMGDVRAGKALAARGAGQQRPYLRTKNVFDGRIDLNDVLRMPMTEAEFSRYRLRHGDVLLNEGQSLELVGRCTMYKDEYPEPCAIQNQLVRFRARDGVSAGFAAQLFRHCQKSGVFTRIALQTTSVAHLGVSRFYRLQLAWPPEAVEQEAIAEALSDADALVESLEQLLAKKRQLKQGAMQQLLTGNKRLPGFSGAGWIKTEIGELPSDWRVAAIGLIAQVKTGPFGSSLHERDYVDDGTPIITVEHLGENSIIHANLPMVSEADRRRLNAYSLEQGDVVFSRVGSVDRNALITAAESEWLFSGRLLRVRASSRVVDTRYLSYQFHSEPFKQRVRTVAVGQTMSSLNTQILKGVLVALPTVPEQAAIAAILSGMDAEITTLEAKLAKARQLKQGMIQELLTGRIRLV